jgi:hypothetical protein
LTDLLVTPQQDTFCEIELDHSADYRRGCLDTFDGRPTLGFRLNSLAIASDGLSKHQDGMRQKLNA